MLLSCAYGFRCRLPIGCRGKQCGQEDWPAPCSSVPGPINGFRQGRSAEVPAVGHADDCLVLRSEVETGHSVVVLSMNPIVAVSGPVEVAGTGTRQDTQNMGNWKTPGDRGYLLDLRCWSGRSGPDLFPSSKCHGGACRKWEWELPALFGWAVGDQSRLSAIGHLSARGAQSGSR
jgi:hypothetical protein